MRRLIAPAVLLGLAALTVAACTHRDTEDMAGKEPRLVPEEFLVGNLRAWGMIEDRFGKPRSQFTVQLAGRWDGRELILDEDFVYDSGRRQKRQWRFQKTGPGRYEGRAADVPGIAVGTVAGNAFHLRYPLEIPRGDGTMTVDMDDWLYLQPGGVAINRAWMSKFGIGLGEMTIVLQRQP